MRFLIFLSLLFFSLTPLAHAAEVSLESLLKEMSDRSSIARFPDPAFTCKQASSYDRTSVAPDKPGWFANGDNTLFLREETNENRQEWVLMDEKGPGAVVRFWITAGHYKSNCRIYLDGNETPAIEANLGRLLGGEALVGFPFSEDAPPGEEVSQKHISCGKNLFLPIPYAKSCKITIDKLDEQKGLFYQINFRTYESGTSVQTFTKENLKELEPLLREVKRELLDDERESTAKTLGPIEFSTLKAGEKTIVKTVKGSGAQTFSMQIKGEDMSRALRSTLLRIAFDGKETVCCPVGDFFGTGVGIHPYTSRYSAVGKDGVLVSRWWMPFKSQVEYSLQNCSDRDVEYKIATQTHEFPWTDRTMYFHGNWRQERDIKTIGGTGTKDFNYISVGGKGVYAGDSLALVNHSPNWWGEGDEKIYVDGEQFPSHFGTGTEDYYGYAWGQPLFFESPFHTQPLTEPGYWQGKTINSRYRILDAIPFMKDLRFDMEIWHWSNTEVDYAVATYWYALGEATTNQPGNIIEEARVRIPDTTDFRFHLPGYKFSGPIRGSFSLQPLKTPDGIDYEQLWWTGGKPGEEFTIFIDVPSSGKQELSVLLTKANDYGTVQFYFDGKKVGPEIDLFSDAIVRTAPISLGTVDTTSGQHTLGVKIVGKNEQSKGYFFGLDEIQWKKR